MIDVKSIVFFGIFLGLVACSSETVNFGAGGEAGADAGTGGAAGAAVGGAAGVAVGGQGGHDSGDSSVEAQVVCNGVTCDENACSVTCDDNGVTKWCRNFNGAGYGWYAQAFCGTPEYPYGTTFVCGEESQVCCSKTNNWQPSC